MPAPARSRSLPSGPPVPPRPLRSAPTVPLTAAGCEPLFLFGTLMDEEVLARVLGRALAGGALARAELRGFRREAAQGVPYPVLVPDPRTRVAGRLLANLSERDIARINHYESGEYRAELHPVRTGAGLRPAWLFMADPGGLRPAGVAWDLGGWASSHKETLLAACEAWMADCAA